MKWKYCTAVDGPHRGEQHAFYTLSGAVVWRCSGHSAFLTAGGMAALTSDELKTEVVARTLVEEGKR